MNKRDWKSLEDFASSLFEAAGVNATDSRRVACSLVEANLCGHDSHGVIRVIQYIKAIEAGILVPNVPLKIISETPAVICADAGWNLGQVQAYGLLEKIVPKAKAIGLGSGTLKNCGHIGRLGEYAEAMARHNMVFIATVNNHGFGRAVAPPGGKAGRISTNPVCISSPTAEDPVVLDMGTSVVAEGKVRIFYNKKEAVPEGWLLDAEGKPTTDPNVLYHDPKGTLLPLGGSQAYKGFGLGMLMDMLAGGLSGAPCSTPGMESRSANAVFFLLINPEMFSGSAHFLSETTKLAKNVRECPKVDSFHGAITLPGELEIRQKEKRRVEGINIDAGTTKQLEELAHKLKVSLPW
jgi:uncharacterized oxidoreductase